MDRAVRTAGAAMPSRSEPRSSPTVVLPERGDGASPLSVMTASRLSNDHGFRAIAFSRCRLSFPDALLSIVNLRQSRLTLSLGRPSLPPGSDEVGREMQHRAWAIAAGGPGMVPGFTGVRPRLTRDQAARDWQRTAIDRGLSSNAYSAPPCWPVWTRSTHPPGVQRPVATPAAMRRDRASRSTREEQRARRDTSPWTLVQGVLAPLQFVGLPRQPRPGAALPGDGRGLAAPPSPSWSRRWCSTRS